MKESKVDRWKNIIIVGTMLIPIVYIFTFVNYYGVNLPIFDEYDFLTFMDRFIDGQVSLRFILNRHNEHLMVIPNLLFMANVVLTDYNVTVLLNFNALLVMLIYLFFAFFVFKNFTFYGKTEKSIITIIIGLIIVHPCQTENFLWGFQIAWYMISLLVTLAIFLYSGVFKLKRGICELLLGLCIIFAGISSLQGLFVGSTIVFLIIVDSIKRKELYKNDIIIICIWLIIGLIYAVEFLRNSANCEHYLKEIPYSVLAMLGFPIGMNKIKLAFAVGIILAIVSVGVFITIIRKKKMSSVDLVVVGFMVYSVTCVIAEAYGRSFTNWKEIATTQRYSTNTILLYISLIIYFAYSIIPLIKVYATRKLVLGSALIVLVVSFLPFVIQARNRSQFYINTCNVVINTQLQEDFDVMTNSTVRDVELLRKRGWSLFAR